MKKILFVVFITAAVGAGAYYWRGASGQRELQEQYARRDQQSRASRASLRKITIDGAESLAAQLEKIEQLSFENEMKTTRNQPALEAAHEAKITNIRLQRAASIEKAKRDYPE